MGDAAPAQDDLQNLSHDKLPSMTIEVFTYKPLSQTARLFDSALNFAQPLRIGSNPLLAETLFSLGGSSGWRARQSVVRREDMSRSVRRSEKVGIRRQLKFAGWFRCFSVFFMLSVGSFRKQKSWRNVLSAPGCNAVDRERV